MLAWFWYGSYSIQRWSPGSDLDAAVLFRRGTSVNGVRERILAHLGREVRLCLRRADPGRLICYAGAQHLKVECVLATEPDQLGWLADSDDVPPPRLVLALEREGAGQALASRAEQPCSVNAAAVAVREIDKFLDAFEACSRSHRRSDAYGFYFHYNLALGRLARLVQIARHKPERLYLPPQLTNTRLRLEERSGFIDLAGSLYLPEANALKRKLAAKFLDFVAELSQTLPVETSVAELKAFLDAICQRDYFWNVRDWADHLDGWVRPNVLIRSSALTGWQQEEVLTAWLKEQEVRQILDLRSDKEVEEKPYAPEVLRGITYARYAIVQEGPMDSNDRSAHYLGIAQNNLSAIVEVLRQLAVAPGCSVVHCNAGVDRTGVVMALLGKLLGLPRELLLEDYVASGADLHRHSMSRFLDAIAARGGAGHHLRKAGLEDVTVERLRERLVTVSNPLWLTPKKAQ